MALSLSDAALSRSISAFAFDHPLTGVTPFVVNTRSQRPTLGTLSEHGHRGCGSIVLGLTLPRRIAYIES